MNVISILLKVIELFSVVILGYILVAKKIVPSSHLKSFSNLILKVTLPAMIITAMAIDLKVNRDEILLIVVLSATTYGFLISMSFILPKIMRIDNKLKGLYSFFAVFGNVGFIGYPVLLSILGEGSLFYGAIFNMPFNLLVYTLGIYFINHRGDRVESKHKLSIRNIFNTGVVATIIGLFFFIGKIEIPEFIRNPMESLGNITSPLALFITGGSLYGARAKEIVKNYKLLLYSLVKLLVFPTLLAVGLYLFSVQGTIAQVAIILTGMPFGANTVILAQKYDNNAIEASEGVFLSTLLLLLSVPYLVFLIQFF